MWATRVAAGVVALVALTGCGDRPEVALSTDGSRTASVQSDLLTARRVVLTPVDLPGYDVDPGAEPDPATVQAAAGFQRCAGAGVAALGDDERTAQSPGFHRGTSTSVSSLATVAVDEAQARAAMSDLSRPELNGCITDLLRALFERELKVPVTSASTQILSDGSAPSGRQRVTWHTTLQFTAGAEKQVAYSDLTFMRSDRILASLFNFQLGTPYPTEERSRLAAAMTGRMGG